MNIKNIKCAIVGDGTVGKTTFLRKYCENIYSSKYKPTEFNIYNKTIHYNDYIINLTFYDMAGQDDYRNLRKQYYDDTIDIFIVAFAINNRDSFNNIIEKWIPEIQGNNIINNKPLLLIGTKLDIRQLCDNIILEEEGNMMAETLFCQYFECSSFFGTNITNIVDKIIDITTKKIVKTKKKNCIMM